MTQIIPTAEPFFFPGKGAKSRIGCLVIHGFTGAPKEVRWLGEYLNRQGYSVCGVRLAGHATKLEDMIRTRYSDWLLSVEDGYNMLHSCADQIFLLGLSMGGILALLFSTHVKVAGVVAMSTPYKLTDDVRLRWAKLISWFIPYLQKSKRPDEGWFDKESMKQHVAYPLNPIRSIAELDKLTGLMRAALPDVHVPVLLIHSHDDNYIFKESMPFIYKHLGSREKQVMWLEGSGHVITEEPKREVVFKAAADFIRKVIMHE